MFESIDVVRVCVELKSWISCHQSRPELQCCSFPKASALRHPSCIDLFGKESDCPRVRQFWRSISGYPEVHSRSSIRCKLKQLVAAPSPRIQKALQPRRQRRPRLQAPIRSPLWAGLFRCGPSWRCCPHCEICGDHLLDLNRQATGSLFLGGERRTELRERRIASRKALTVRFVVQGLLGSYRRDTCPSKAPSCAAAVVGLLDRNGRKDA